MVRGRARRPRAAAAAVDGARHALAAAVRRRRGARGVTQVRLAQLLGSSQSRVAKMEAAARSVSLDLLVGALAVLGATAADVAAELAVGGRRGSLRSRGGRRCSGT